MTVRTTLAVKSSMIKSLTYWPKGDNPHELEAIDVEFNSGVSWRYPGTEGTFWAIANAKSPGQTFIALLRSKVKGQKLT